MQDMLFVHVLHMSEKNHMSNICKIGYVDICQEKYAIHDVNICLHDKLHMYDICKLHMYDILCRTYVDICPIPTGTQVYPFHITETTSAELLNIERFDIRYVSGLTFT